jgi:hypothetical protein
MTLTEPPRRSDTTALTIVILLGIIQLSVSLLTNGFCLSFDEAIWHYIGRNWVRFGLIPYAGGVDNKSPLIFAIYGWSDYFFGVNYWFPRVLGTLCQSIGIYYVYLIASRSGGKRRGIIALSLYGLSLMWRSTDGKWVSLTETYEMTLIIFSFYRFFKAEKRKDFLISGVFAGLAAGFRLSAFFPIVAIFTASIAKKKEGTVAFCAGVMSAILILLALASIAGIHIQDFFSYAFSDNFGTGSPTDHSFLWKLEQFTSQFFYSELILFYPSMLAYFLIYKKWDTLTLWLIWAFIGIAIIGIYDRAHLKEILPAISLISAAAIDYAIDRFKIPGRTIIIVLWIVFFPKLLEPIINLKKLWTNGLDQPDLSCQVPYTKPEDGSLKKLGYWIKSATHAGDKVLVAGFGAQVQVYAERISPSVYFNVTQTHAAKERFFQDIRTNQPEMILVPRFTEYNQQVDQDIRFFIDDLISKKYFFIDCRYGYNIYHFKPVHDKK